MQVLLSVNSKLWDYYSILRKNLQVLAYFYSFFVILHIKNLLVSIFSSHLDKTPRLIYNILLIL